MALTKASSDLVTYTPAGGSETTVQEALVPNQGSLRIDFGEGGTATNSSDPVVNVNRNVNDAGYSGNGHCFSDSSTVNRSGGVAYNSFDCRIGVSGSNSYDHFASFQNGISHGTSGTTTNLYGFADIPQVTNGTVTNRYGIKIWDANLSGSGAVTNNYGIFIDQLNSTSGNQYGIFQQGYSKNVFQGQTLFQSTVNLNDTVVDDSAVAGTRISVGSGSTYDLSVMKADYSAYVWTVPTGTNASHFFGGITSFGIANGSVFPLTCDQSLYGSSAVGQICFKNSNGVVGQIQTSGTATSYLTSSDYRLKENIEPLENGVDKLKALKPVSFDWKADGVRVDGFIAHEAQEVIPEAVSGQKDATRLEDVKNEDGEPTGETISVPDYQGIDQSKIVPVLVSALQEALNRIEALEAKFL